MIINPKNPYRIYLYYIFLIIAVVIALAGAANAQVWYRPNYSNGVPVFNPNQGTSFKYSCTDTTTGMGYLYDGVTKKWIAAPNLNKGMKGDNGANGQAATITAGTTITLPAGSNATVTNRGSSSSAIFDFGIPRGQDGQSGTGALVGYENPDAYGAVHRNQALTASDVGQYAAVGAQIGNQRDWAAISMACKNANREAVLLYGEYYVDRTILMNQFDYFDVIQSNGAIIYTTNSNTYPVISRPVAANENDAIKMESTIMYIQNLDIQIHGNQIGVQPQPASNVTLINVRVFGQGTGTGFKLEFDMQAYLLNCLGHTVYDAFQITWGGFSTASITNAQSNWTKLQTCMAYNASHIGFKIEQSYGVKMEGCVVQGNTPNLYDIYFDSQNSNTVKDFTVDGHHHEVNGGTTAIAYVRMQNGSFKFSNLSFQANVSTTYIDAGAQQSMLTIVERINYWKDNSHFKTLNSAWNFRDCIAIPGTSIENLNLWDRTNGGQTPCFTNGCGINFVRNY